MLNKSLFISVVISSLVASIVSAAWFVGSKTEKLSEESDQQLVSKIDKLSATVKQQQRLIEELERSIVSQTAQPQPVLNALEAVNAQQPAIEEEQASEEQNRVAERLARANNPTDFRSQRLIDSGFSNDEAAWILQNESDVQLASLYEQYRARRAQLALEQENGTRAKTRFEQLRERLGDDTYERYLEANGYPTSIGVGSVLEGSPGANAGLRAGDRILSYNGNRVFNIRELNGLTVQGDEGRSVLLEIERDGNPIQITLPRGPIGITGGRRGRF
ncbi:MAG: PDZ domain-containing protein [Acidiferrobacterales bacterium]|nr:PDZ domain-containing protein [Acidiferrobacterales bacterium]